MAGYGSGVVQDFEGATWDNFENFVFQKVIPVVGDVAGGHNL
jgi:hypothetical protein